MKELLKTVGWPEDKHHLLGRVQWEKEGLNTEGDPVKYYMEFNKKQSTVAEAFVDMEDKHGKKTRLFHAQWVPSSYKDHLLMGCMMNGKRRTVINSDYSVKDALEGKLNWDKETDKHTIEKFKSFTQDAKKMGFHSLGLFNKQTLQNRRMKNDTVNKTNVTSFTHT